MSSRNSFLITPYSYGNVSQWGSQWNDPIDWTTINYSVSAKGRKFARHPSGLGVVMSMNDGTDRNVLVLYSQYRTGAPYYVIGTENLNLTRCTKTGYFAGSAVTLPFDGKTDDELNAGASLCNQDPNSSKVNTDNLIAKGSLAGAANYCRNITISHNGITVGCDFPNINVLIRIFCEMKQIDAMDDNKTSTNCLSNWRIKNNTYCWSSSWYGPDGSRYYALALSSDGNVDNDRQHYACGVVPVLEI